MKSDDPELEKTRQEMIDRAQKMDALTLSVLRTHLLAEQCMNDYITASGLKKRWLKKSFSQKIKKCKQLSKAESSDPLWDVLTTANNLRNAIAHSLEVDDVKEKSDQLSEKYFTCLTEEQMADIKDQSDDFIVMSACSTCAGFIATLLSRLGGGTSAEAAKRT